MHASLVSLRPSLPPPVVYVVWLDIFLTIFHLLRSYLATDQLNTFETFSPCRLPFAQEWHPIGVRYETFQAL